jgi:hypothetical protein
MEDDRSTHRVSVEFDDFGWARLVHEAERQQVPVEDLVAHAVTYFLADKDSGRQAHRVMRALADEDAATPERPESR